MSNAKPNGVIAAAVFSDGKDAESAIEALANEGISAERITVVCSDEAKARHFSDYASKRSEDLSHAGPAVGGVAGLVLGGLISLAGVATTGGVGIFAVGPLIGGGIAGTLVGALMGRGVEGELARFYDQAVSRGQLLVAVHGEEPDDQEVDAVRTIFRENDAVPFELSEG